MSGLEQVPVCECVPAPCTSQQDSVIQHTANSTTNQLLLSVIPRWQKWGKEAKARYMEKKAKEQVEQEQRGGSEPSNSVGDAKASSCVLASNPPDLYSNPDATALSSNNTTELKCSPASSSSSSSNSLQHKAVERQPAPLSMQL